MPFYSHPFTFDFQTSLINIDSGFTDVDCDSLYTAIKLAQASEEGIIYGRIAAGTGLVELGPGVQVGLTVELLGSWQLRFAVGNYVARVAGGNLVGGPGADPIAYSAGVQVLLIQSAASTIVTSSVDGVATAVWSAVDSANNLPGTMGAKVNATAPDATKLIDVWRRLGLDPANPLVNTATLISAGTTLQIDVTQTATTVTTTRQP
jgi:hypothetical protein